MSHLDRGRAYEVFRTDWRDLPARQREAAFLDALEQCIEPDPGPPPTLRRDIHALLDPNLRTVLIALIIWDLTGPIWRLGLQISHGQPIDLLPFITLALGGFALWRYLRTPHHRSQ